MTMLHGIRYLVLRCGGFGFVLLLLSSWASLADVAVPPYKGKVLDQTESLDLQHIQSIESQLAKLESAKGSQLAVLLVPSTKPVSIENYARRVAEQWGLGKGTGDGALLLVAKNDRTLRIEVGYGLESKVPDALAKRIIDEQIVPRFQQGDFPGGVQAGVASMVSLIQGEPLPIQRVGQAESTVLGEIAREGGPVALEDSVTGSGIDLVSAIAGGVFAALAVPLAAWVAMLAHVLISKRSYGGAKAGWALLVFVVPFIGYAVFLIMTQKGFSETRT